MSAGIFRTGSTLLLAVALSGCASMNSVHWVYPGPGKSRVFSTDAFQRHLIMTEDAQGKVRTCSEASPDAMTVFSASLTGRGIVGPSERALEAAAAVGQTAASIERTQTINMLREWMFRTCELWLSGALSKSEFLTRSARDHRSMIAILAVEQLTGVVKAPATIISGPAATAALAHGKEVAELLKSYRDERATAEAAEASAATSFAQANVDHDDGTGAKKLCAYTGAPSGKEAEYAACKVAEAKVASTKASADTTREREKLVLNQLGALSAGLSAGVSGGTNNAGGLTGGQSRLSDAALAAVGGSVERIALTAGVDEALMFCVGYLRERHVDASTRTVCNDVVRNAAARDVKLVGEAFSVSLEAQDRATQIYDSYGSFRLDLAGLIAATPASDWNVRWNAFITKIGDRSVTCASQTICQSAFGSGAGNPLLLGFTSQSQLYAQAIADWRKALSGGASS